MRESEAVRHEETPEHTYLVREISRETEATPSSPFHMSSPFQESSDPPSPYRHPEPNTFTTVPGPWLPGDNPTLLYNDWDNVWGPDMPRKPDSDSGEDDLVSDDGWEGPGSYPLLLSDPDSEGEDRSDSEIPEDDPFDVALDALVNDGDLEGLGLCEDFGAAAEAEDMTEDRDINGLDEDWWPWANREVRALFLNFLVRLILNYFCRKLF